MSRALTEPFGYSVRSKMQGRLLMKTALFLSAFAASLALASTTSFAQNYTAYSQSVGDAAVTAAAPYAGSYGRLMRSHASYGGRVTAPASSATPAAAMFEPAPAQER
jgi:hypothetical protein